MTVESPRPPRRKRLLINTNFQARFAVYALVTTLLILPIFYAANYYFFNLLAQKAHSLGLPLDHELLQFVNRQQTFMVLVFILATVLAIIVNIIASYIFSNRIAGSLYRLTSEMNSASDFHQANEVKLRKGDYFPEVYEAFNGLLKRSKN